MNSPKPASDHDQSTPPPVAAPDEIVSGADLAGPAVALPQPPLVAIKQSVAFALSITLF